MSCVARLYSNVSSFSKINSTFDNFSFSFTSPIKYYAIVLSLENDKNDLQNTIDAGKPSILVNK